MFIDDKLEPGDKFVYLHRRNSDQRVFYVGIGVKRRPKTKSKRNIRWKNIVNKHGYSIEVLYAHISEKLAKQIEQFLIFSYRQLGQCEANITDGGDGMNGVKGENHPQFKGYWLFYNLEEEVYWLCNGTTEMERDGFEQSTASQTKAKKTEYITSRKIHKNGVKIRFQVHHSADIDELTNFIVDNELNEAELSDGEIDGNAGANNPSYGKNAQANPNFKGHYVGTSSDEIIILTGNKMVKDLGFEVSNLNACAKGRVKTSKGFKWTQSRDLKEYINTNLRPVNEYTAQLIQT